MGCVRGGVGGGVTGSGKIRLICNLGVGRRFLTNTYQHLPTSKTESVCACVCVCVGGGGGGWIG